MLLSAILALSAGHKSLTNNSPSSPSSVQSPGVKSHVVKDLHMHEVSAAHDGEYIRISKKLNFNDDEVRQDENIFAAVIIMRVLEEINCEHPLGTSRGHLLIYRAASSDRWQGQPLPPPRHIQICLPGEQEHATR